MARMAFLDKFSGSRSPAPREELALVLRNLSTLLNTREGYGFFRRGFGLGGYTAKTASDLLPALVAEIEHTIAEHEPRLKEVEVEPRGRDSRLWLHLSLEGRLQGAPCRLRILFDTTTGQVLVQEEP